MAYSIKIADISDPVVHLALCNLIKETYNYKELLPAGFLGTTLDTRASKPGFFLVAEEKGAIVGCNGFISGDFLLNGTSYTGFQSCWSVTHPQHQGKNIFSNLINEAKRKLKVEGAGFIYGIANNKSNPIITKKLGFVETHALRLRIPNLPVIRNRYFSNAIVDIEESACCIDEAQLLAQKFRQFPAEVKVINYKDSWLWGKVLNKKKYGINWPIFFVGGVHLSDVTDINELLPLIFRLHSVAFVQFLSNQTNSFNSLLNGWVKPKMNGFIYFNLNMPKFDHLNIMIGAMDVF